MTEYQWRVIIALCRVVLAQYWNWDHLTPKEIADRQVKDLNLISEAIDRQDYPEEKK